LYTYVENNPLIYNDPSGHSKASDNAELLYRTTSDSESWASGNAKQKLEAEKHADMIRVAYYNNKGLPIPSDVKYTTLPKGFQAFYDLQSAYDEIPAIGGLGGGAGGKSLGETIKAPGGTTVVKPAWKPITEEQARSAMQGAPLQTQQNAVSLPMINDYAKRLSNGEIPPAIKVDKGMIVDGNHRYIASRVVGVDIPQINWSGGNPNTFYNWSNIKFDPSYWSAGTK
jgi:hypothetical protein